jgi:hypothetical protein
MERLNQEVGQNFTEGKVGAPQIRLGKFYLEFLLHQ